MLAAAFSPDGRLVATGGGEDNAIHVWDPLSGETKAVLKGDGAHVWSAFFAADGRSIAWGHSVKPSWVTNDIGPAQLALRLPAGDEPLGAPAPVAAGADWRRAIEKLGAWSLELRKGGRYDDDNGILDVLKDGKAEASIELGPSEGYVHKSFTFTPDGETIVSGAANGRITAFSLDGKRIGAFTGHEADVWAVVPSPDGRYLVSGSWDQTARLWNLATRELIVTIFRGADGEWAVWTPQGYFAASPGGGNLIGWQIDRGPEKTAVYVTGTQLHEFLERPDIVSRAIALASAREAVAAAPHLGRGLEELLAGVREGARQ